jgi:hypothetical protein
LALATGCYHSERVTGVFCLDSAPVDHRYFDSFVELKNYVQKCRDIKLNADRKDIDA